MKRRCQNPSRLLILLLSTLSFATETGVEAEQGPDTANLADTIKSWTSEYPPDGCNKGFLDSLDWKEYRLQNGFTLRTGKIFKRWIAATQFYHKGKLVLTEYTPPLEYMTVLDPENGEANPKVKARDANHDGVPEIAFLHEKLDDRKYHMYTVFALRPDGVPTLLWKSGGHFGDWQHKANQRIPGGELWQGSAKNEPGKGD